MFDDDRKQAFPTKQQGDPASKASEAPLFGPLTDATADRVFGNKPSTLVLDLFGDRVFGKMLREPTSEELADMKTFYRSIPQIVTIPGSPDAQKRFRHRKRGTTYRVLGAARLQIDYKVLKDAGLDYGSGGVSEKLDMAEMVIYQSESDFSLWVRFREEFFDGRFEELADE